MCDAITTQVSIVSTVSFPFTVLPGYRPIPSAVLHAHKVLRLLDCVGMQQVPLSPGTYSLVIEQHVFEQTVPTVTAVRDADNVHAT